MITHTKAFKTSTGKTFDTLEAAQIEEIESIVGSGGVPETVNTAAVRIVADKSRVLDILSTKENSRTRARKINGSVRKPRAQTATTVKA